MNFENSNNTQESQEKIPAAAVENLDAEKFEEGEISDASMEEIARADANIAEIAALNDAELAEKLQDPEKKAKITAALEKAKGWALTVAAAATMAGSWGYGISTDLIGRAEQMTSLQTFNAGSVESIVGTLMVITPILTGAAFLKRSYDKFSKEQDAIAAAKAQPKM